MRLLFSRVVLLAGLVASACAPASQPSGSTSPAQTEPPPPQRLTIGNPNFLANLDPHSNAGSYNGIKYTLFDTITRVDDKGNVGPWLATSWKVVNDTTWEFALRNDVRFSNGEALDAAAVKFTIDRLVNPENRLPLAGRIPLVSGAEVVNATTVRFLTRRPDAILPARMAAIFVVPPAEVQRLGAADFGLKPVGTGPFKLVEFVQDTRLVLEKYPESWRKSTIERLTFLHLPDGSSRVAALRTGDVQMIYQPPLDALAGLERDGFVVASTTYARLHVTDLDTITEDTPLRNKLVRQALNYAVDKEAILKQIYGGRGRVADGQLVGPIGFGYDNTLKPYPYDPARARQLLAQAGYPNGFTLKMETPTSCLAIRDQTTALAGYLREVGVTTEIEVLENAPFLDRFYNRNGAKRAPLFNWCPNYFPAMDADFTFQWYTTDAQKKVFSNPEVDRLYQQSTTELDPQRRLGLLKQISAILREEAPVIFIIEPDDIHVISKRVQGFKPRSDGETQFEQISLTR
ncbi:MAG: ABC transporter substrate-binding protein [Dehalococcoidia bacterium]|nr:MAG: ABC transporter substrate-binding protein [Dehalococcoidia bacterium]